MSAGRPVLLVIGGDIMSSFVRLACLGGFLFAAVLGSTAAVADVPTAELTPLAIDFNDKTPGQSLGTGGAAFGEPVSLGSLNSLIVETSPGENALQVSSYLSSYNARALRWEFEDGLEVSEGLVSISLDFTPSARDRYQLYVREQGGATKSFLSLNFLPDGSFVGSDAAGAIGWFFNPSYDAGDTLHIEMLFDMDARTSSLTINGTPIFSGREHGISDRGIGAVLTGISYLSNGSRFTLDNLLVLANVPLPLVLDADFNNQSPGQPVRFGGPVYGEPVFFSPGIAQQAAALNGNDLGMRLWKTAPSASEFARWEFLNDAEINTGIVAFEMDVRMQPSQSYEISVNGPANANTMFATIRFTPDRIRIDRGYIEIVDSRGSTAIVGTYQTNVFHHLQIVFDMDTRTYTAKLDSDNLGSRGFGATNGVGIASLQTGFPRKSLTGSGNSMDIDNLQVGASAGLFTP